jgi:hypothetical protein
MTACSLFLAHAKTRRLLLPLRRQSPAVADLVAAADEQVRVLADARFAGAFA